MLEFKRVTAKIIINKIKKIKPLNIIWSIVRLLFILSLAYVILNPIIVKISVAFKDISDYKDSTIMFIPKHFTLEYVTAFYKFVDYGRTLINTILYAATNSILQVFSCALVAYSISRFKSKLSSIIMALLLLTVIIPPQAVLLPLYLQFRYFSFISLFSIVPPEGGLSLLNTYLPYGILSISCLGIKNGLFVLLLRQLFINMPIVLEEAASIDGCGPFKTFYKIMLPSAVPMMITIFLFAFVWTWNDNLYTMFFASNLKILPNFLNEIFYKIGLMSSPLSSQMNISIAVLFHMTPIIFLYIFAQRYFVQSIERSGIVG